MLNSAKEYKANRNKTLKPSVAVLDRCIRFNAEDQMEESVWSVVRPENEREDQGEGVQNSGKTGTGVRGRDMVLKKTGK